MDTFKSGAGRELNEADIEVLRARSKLSEAGNQAEMFDNKGNSNFFYWKKTLEIRKLHENFWVENPGGLMTVKSYENFHKRQLHHGTLRKFPHDLAFTLFDTDQSRELDFVEFLMANAFQSSTSTREALEYLFDMCDYTGDGRMNMSELATFNKFVTNAAKETQAASNYEVLKVAGQIFAFIGLNSDRKLTKKEFIDECEKIPLIKSMFKIKK